jgi:hypothetical protein
MVSVLTTTQKHLAKRSFQPPDPGPVAGWILSSRHRHYKRFWQYIWLCDRCGLIHFQRIPIALKHFSQRCKPPITHRCGPKPGASRSVIDFVN